MKECHSSRGVWRFVFVAALILLTAVACDRAADSTTSTTAANSTPKTAKKQYSRVFAHSPALGEIAFAIGAGDSIVAVSKHAEYPVAVKKLPRLAVLPIQYEALLEVNPDLILCQNMTEDLRSYQKLGEVEIFEHKVEAIADVYAAIGALAATLNAESGGKARIKEIKQKIETIKASNKDGKRPRVFLSLSRQPGDLKSVFSTSGGFLTELLTISGADNVFAGHAKRYMPVNLEAIMDANPDLIIEIKGESISEAEKKRLLEDWGRIDNLNCAKNGQIMVLSGSELLLPGPRIVQSLAKISQAVQKWRQSQK